MNWKTILSVLGLAAIVYVFYKDGREIFANVQGLKKDA